MDYGASAAAVAAARLWEKSLTNISASTAEHRGGESFFWFLNTPVRVRGSGDGTRARGGGNIFPLMQNRPAELWTPFYSLAFIYSFALKYGAKVLGKLCDSRTSYIASVTIVQRAG